MWFWEHLHPVARKSHRCDMCGRTIDAGEKYLRGQDPYEEGYSDVDFHEFEPATDEQRRWHAGWTAKWRDPDGNLLPPPRPDHRPGDDTVTTSQEGPSFILCVTDNRDCTCGAPADTPGGMHHDYCPCNPASRATPAAPTTKETP